MILSDYAIKFRTAVFVFIVVLVIIGGAAYMRLPREGAPDITIPYVFVTALYEGTAPEEIEKLITVPLEKEINDVENVKEIRSTSAENVCSITVEFVAGENIDLALQRVKDKVDLAKPDLPDDLDEPIVQAFNFSSDFPVFVFALSGDVEPLRLKKIVEALQDQIEQVAGVKEAVVSGTREREIRVEIDLPRLIAYGIPLPQVMQRVAQENSTVSAGNLEMRGNKFQVRVPGEFALASEIENILLAEINGRPVYLSDVATVRDTFKDVESISRINGRPSVSLSVKKRSGENTVALISRIKAVLDDFNLAPDIRMSVVLDESDYIYMMLHELENNIVTGFLLVIAVLLVFMGGRNSLFVALAIPFSMLTAFTLLAMHGSTLNMIVLFGLVLAVGMLVDNAIVIVENIYRHRTMGLSRIDAAREGASEVAWPVVTSTLTTLAAFSPLLFWPDIIGQFMSYLPRTLITVLSASLFVALVINPAVCSALITAGNRKSAGGRARPHRFVEGYERLLRGALRHRVPILLLGFAVLVLTVQIYGRFGKGFELFPEVEPRNATIQIKFPQGTGIERTDAALRPIEQKLLKYRDIEFFLTTVGAGSGLDWSGGQSGTHYGQILVEFLDFNKRETPSGELVDRIRKDVGSIPGAEVKVEKQREGPPVGAPVSIEVSGEDFETLARLSSEIVRTIETVPGLVDLEDDLEQALPEIQFAVDRHRAAMLGLDTDTIGLFLRTAIYGLETSKFRADEDEWDITLRLPPEQRDSMKLLDQIYIPVAGGARVPLSSVGKVVYTGGRGSINRKNQKRVITISGNNQGRGVDKIIEDDIRPRLSKMNLPRGYAIDYAGDTKEMRESGAFLGRAFAIAIALILVILVIQFNSALLPLIIICSVLLSLVGVMWGLLICRMRFGVIMTGVGVISLAGIVVNNAIVLVDCIRQREKQGMSIREAVIDGGRTRLRPVLLTAVTTILGLIPMAVGYSLQIHDWPPRLEAGAESSQWWAPMAVAVIFGLGVATVLTLVLVPVMYDLAESVAAWFRRFAPRDKTPA